MTTKKLELPDYVQCTCTKCEKRTKHIVVGLVDGVPTKVQCTLCKSDHNYRKEPAHKKSPRPKSNSHNLDSQDWLASAAKWDEDKAVCYAMGGVFKRGDLLRHEHFGLGVVRSVPGTNRMQVLFQEGEKLLRCGK